MNAEDIGHVPLVHAVSSGNLTMVEAVLAHDVSLCMPDILQEAVLAVQKSERELNSFRSTNTLPPHLGEYYRKKREQAEAATGGVVGGTMAMPAVVPGSVKHPSTSSSAAANGSSTASGANPTSPVPCSSSTSLPNVNGTSLTSAPSNPHDSNTASTTTTTIPQSAPSHSATMTATEKMMQEDLENRISIVLMLLRANVRLPLTGNKPIWLPYFRSHASFKQAIDSMLSEAAYTFDEIRTSKFAHTTSIDLTGSCLDDDKTTLIAKLLIAPPSGVTPLMHLNLSRNWIEQRGATEIGNAVGRNTTLLTLNMSHNYILDCTHMMRGMKDNKTLKTLDLSANRLATIAGEAIAMRIPTMRLTTLNLSMNKLEYRGGSQILRAVLFNPTVGQEETVDESTLAFNSSGRAPTRGSPLISDAANGTTSSTTQNTATTGSPGRRGSISSSQLSSNSPVSSASAAIDTVPVSTLTSLNLSSNEIHPYEKNLWSDDMVEKLTNNNMLISLDLSFNWLERSDIVRLIRALAHNVTLSQLSLKGYALSEDDLKQCMAALSLNHTLTTFEFNHAPPNETKDAVRRHVFKNSAHFSNSHLVHDPIIPDSIDPSSLSSSSQQSSQDLSNSASSLPSSSSTPTTSLASSSNEEGGATSELTTSAPSDQSGSPSLDGKAPTRLSNVKTKSESLASVPQLSPRDACPTDVKQYGIVRRGDSTSDSVDFKSIPSLDEKEIPVVPNGQVNEVHAAMRSLHCFPPCILGYDHLTKLVLQRNKLNSLPRSIGCLKNLVLLDVRNNRLPALPPEIGDLPKLVFLLASYNKLQFVPMQLTRQASLRYVLLDPNPLTLVPPNFRKNLASLWKKPFNQSELYQYLKTIGACGEGTFNKGRLMLVGDPAVGKTTIRKTLVKGKSGFNLFEWIHSKSATPEISVATDGIDIDVVRMSDKEGKKYTFDVWDYAGHEVYYTTHTFFLSPRAVYLLVFNMENYSRLSIEYWMQSIVFKAGTDAPIFLVGTHPEKLSPTERTNLLKQLKSNYRGIFIDHVWINPVTGEGVEELKQKICKVAATRKLVGEMVPKSYMRIADQLLATAHSRPYMPLKEIAGIVLSNDVSQESCDAAISWLIDIGAVLSYSVTRSPDQIVFIDPQFLCNTFSQVVSIKYSSTTGRLSRGIIASICRHDAKLQAELFRILRSFDLAYVLKRAQDDLKYESTAAEQDIELFVPALLADNEPPDFSKHWKPNPTMRVYQRHFTFTFLPIGFFSKLLVRCLLLPGVEALCYWSNGLVARKTSLCAAPGGGGSQPFEELFFLKFEPEKSLLIAQANVDQDGLTLAMLVDLIGALIEERYKGANCTSTIPVSTSLYETVYLDVDELASNIAGGQYVRVVDGKVWNISMFAPDLVLRDLSNLRINDADIIKGRRLGVGSFGEVFEATYHDEQCAVKYITRFRILANQSDFFQTRSSDFANFAHEIRIMNLLKHPNIVRMKGYIPMPVGLLMEFFACGDLVGLLEKSPDTPWPLRVRIALDVALGMEYLHILEPPLCHRDLRSPNILLKSKQADSPDPVAKVADFGLTVAVVDRLGYGPTESWRWSAPEVVTAEQYTHRSDIWSFGILLLELIYAELPYQSLQNSLGKQEFEMNQLYVQGAFRPEFPTSFENHLVPPANDNEHEALRMLAQLGRDCCSESADARPPFTTIVKRIYDIIDKMGTLQLPKCIREASQQERVSHEDGSYADDDVVDEADPEMARKMEVDAADAAADEIIMRSSGEVPKPFSTSSSIAIPSSISAPKVTGYVLDTSRHFVLSNRKSPDTFMTTAVKVVGTQLWVGLAEGTLGVWDVSAMVAELGSATPSGVSLDGSLVKFSPIRFVGDHMFSIRGIVVNDTATKLCAISEDGHFTVVNLKDFSTSKFQASPGHTSPLLSVCSIGERIYIGTAKGHVVAWSWDSPTLLAFWDGMDKQPVCQLFYTRGIKDLVVAYGQSIKFLNVFDLGDTLRHWRPHMPTVRAGTGVGLKSVTSSSSASIVRPHPPTSSSSSSSSSSSQLISSISTQTSPPSFPHMSDSSEAGHLRLAASTKALSTAGHANDSLFKNVSECQHAAFIARAGHFVWTKSGPHVRLWSLHKASAHPSSSLGSSSPSASSSSIPGIGASGGSSSSASGPHAVNVTKEIQHQHASTSRSDAFTSSISLYKELISPNTEACYRQLVDPTILSSSTHVFILESPEHVTVWDSHTCSFVMTLQSPSPTQKASIENIFMLRNSLVAIARDRLFIWRPSTVETNSSSSSHPSPATDSPSADTTTLAPNTASTASSPSVPITTNGHS